MTDLSNGHALFDTAFGRAGIAWSDRGVTAVQFPVGSDAATTARLHAQAKVATAPAEPTAAVRDAIARLQRHLEHGREDLTPIALDMRALPPFHAKVYERARAVPAGATVTYGELGAALGSANHSRAVGTAMARNPFVVVVPCHRVMGANGASGGFSAHGGLRSKARLLAREGAALGDAMLSLVTRTGPGFDAPRALAALSSRDPVMGALIERVGDFAMERAEAPSTYEALARAVVHQQLTGKAAATILGRVKALGGDGAFPSPDALGAIPDAALRAAGLSGSKVAALRDLAKQTLSGAVPTLAEMELMDEEDVIARLTPVRGIGRWSAEMLLMFTLGRPDVLPVGDYGVRTGVRLAYGLREMPSPDEVARRGAKWKPWRSVASWYLWRAVDLLRGA